uniref:Uncharacterized protein n=1 Tax=Ananas comosus var. bracteatus TaxID=296719 RepID=A0A6V7P2X2_ANACO|nr:unnamed protein product [Ananas comosus var. bracteatus]
MKEQRSFCCKRPTSILEIEASSSSPELGMAKQLAHVAPDLVCLGPSLGSLENFLATGMGLSDPHGSEAWYLVRRGPLLISLGVTHPQMGPPDIFFRLGLPGTICLSGPSSSLCRSAGREGREHFWMSDEESSGEEPASFVPRVPEVVPSLRDEEPITRKPVSFDPRVTEVVPILREEDPIPGAYGGGVFQRSNPLGSVDEELEEDPIPGANDGGVYLGSDSSTVGSLLGSVVGELEVDPIRGAIGGGSTRGPTRRSSVR